MERLKQIRKHSFIQEVSLEFKCLLYSKHCSRGKDIAMKKTKSHFSWNIGPDGEWGDKSTGIFKYIIYQL